MKETSTHVGNVSTVFKESSSGYKKQLDRLLYFISYYFISQEKFYILILIYKFPDIIKDPQYSRTPSGTLEKHATMVKEQGSGFCKN